MKRTSLAAAALFCLLASSSLSQSLGVRRPPGEPAFSTVLSGPSSVPILNPSGSVGAVLAGLGLGSLPTLPPAVPLSPVVVAVLDSGADLTHPVFQGKVHPASADFVDPGTAPLDVADGIDNDGDGVVDRAFGHGTHVGGLIAAAVPTASIMVLRVVDDEGHGDAADVAAAIQHAVTNGADVINLSLSLSRPSFPVGLALAFAESQGVLVLTSAGNGGARRKLFPTGASGVVTIGATDPGVAAPVPPFGPLPTETIAPFSNYGFVHLASFGVDVLGPYPGGQYAYWSGTSMATAIVSATAAIMLMIDPALSPQQVTSFMAVTAIDVMSGSPLGGDALGAGRVDTLAAAQLAVMSALAP